MQAQFPPYKAPYLSPARAGLINRLCGFIGPFRTDFGAGHAEWEILWDAPQFSPEAAVEIQCGANSWMAFLSDASCIVRHEAFASDEALFAGSEIPDEVRRAVLAALFAPVLDNIQAVLGMAATIGKVELAAAPVTQPAFGIKAKLGGCSGISDQVLLVALVPSSPEAILQLEKSLSALPGTTSAPEALRLGEVPLEVAFESGYLTVSLSDIETLEQGDVLLPEAWTASQGSLVLRLSRGFAPALTAPCQLAEGKAVLEAPLSVDVETAMDSEHNDIDIRLSFELDRRTITVGELSALAPGYVFQLNSDKQAPVTVRANGKAIAQGRIVDMDGVLGVQLTSIL